VNKRVFLFLVAIAALGCVLFSRKQSPPSSSPTPRTPPDSSEITRQFLALEQAAHNQDQTTWAPELDALRHGKTIIDLWDALRSTTNTYSLFARAVFDELHLPTAPSEAPLENGITEIRFDAPLRVLRPNDWLPFLDQFRTQGYALEQSDWRHIAFFPATNSPARSTFAVDLHLNRKPDNTRLQVSFHLEVAWRAATNDLPSMPSLLAIKSVRILKQSGPPQFTHLFSMELPLVPGLETLDPYLAIYDLDRDHIPEIVLAAQNLVLRRTQAGTYSPSPLLPNSQKQTVHAALFGEFNGDGAVDLICADRAGLRLYPGTKAGEFPNSWPTWRAPEPLHNPFLLNSGDIDADGDLDLYFSQYKLPYIAGQMPHPFYNANDGFPAYLLLNDGAGNFSDATASSGLAKKRFRRTYSASFVDLDEDTDLDLIVISDFSGLDFFLNDGTGHFAEITSQIPEPHAFGMAHSIGDFDGNATLDILMTGMNSDTAARLDALGLVRREFPEYAEYRKKLTVGNRLFQRIGGSFIQTTLGQSIAQAGWAWGVSAFDADHDHDVDLYIVNGHNSRQSAMDYESQFWRHDIYIANSEINPVTDLFFQSAASKLYGAGWSYGGYYKNKLFLNQNGTNFFEAAYLLGLSIEEDCRNLVSTDLDADGDLDVVFTTFEQWPQRRQGVHLFRNNLTNQNWTSLVLPERAQAPGTRAVLTLASGQKLVRTYVTGDSYRSQHPPTLHFGLRPGDQAKYCDIFQPGKKPFRLPQFPTNNFHYLVK
jgi:hypothetical protein